MSHLDECLAILELRNLQAIHADQISVLVASSDLTTVLNAFRDMEDELRELRTKVA